MRKITRCLFVVALLGLAPVLAAGPDPTIHQIYRATESGHLAQAEQMMSQVLQDHPNSANAHYVAAEVYARAGDFSTARRQLSAAESLEPGLTFATPQSVAALRAELAQSRFLPRLQQPGYAPDATQAHARSPVPWGLILVTLAGVVIVWAVARRRRQPVYPQYPLQPMGGVGPLGMGGGVVPPYPYTGGPGSLGGSDFGVSAANAWEDGSGGRGPDAGDDFGAGGPGGGGAQQSINGK
jgi:uncharacterized protein